MRRDRLILSRAGNDSPADETNAADHETKDEHLAPAAFRFTSAAWFWNCADAVAEVTFFRNEVVVGHRWSVGITDVGAFFS